MEIFRLFGSILVDNDEANRSISGTERNAEGLGKRFAGGIKTAAKWGAAIAAGATVAAGAVVGMAKPLVEATASAKAMQAQFDQVFDDVADSATEALMKISEETGMLPNRLKGSFTQMAAFAKTTGMETADALSLTERATLAAADSAAFYDKSIEEVSESLQSYLKGNFANDAALGIASTETTRNAKANELYSKSFKDLDEAQKQLTLLQMVEDGNKLSGALGQAALESDAFENQLGNLKQAWQDIKARFGEPILEPAVAMIQKLAEWLVKVDVQPIIDGFKSFASFINDNVVSRIRDAFATIDALYNAFMSVFYDTGEVADVLAKIGLSPESANKLEAFFSSLIGFFQTSFSVISAILDGFMSATMTVFNFIQPFIMPILAAVVGFIQEQLAKITAFWESDGQQIMAAVSNLFNGIMAVIQFIMPAVLFLIESVWGNIKGVISGALDIIMGAIRIFTGLFTGDWSKMWEGVKQLLEGALTFLWNLFSLIMIGKLLGGIKAFVTGGLGFFKNFGASVVSTFKGFIDDVITWFNYFRTTGTSIWSALVDTIKNLITIFKSNIKSSFDDIWKASTNTFNNIKNAIMNPIKTARDAVKGFIDEIKGFFKSMKLELPKIKMPSFTIKNWSMNPADWLKAMPSLGVSWNALGGIFTKPTIFDTRAGLQGVGEAGPEAILPLNDRVLSTIGRAIMQTIPAEQAEKTIIIQPAPIYLDGRVIAEVIFDTVDAMQYDRSTINAAVRGVNM